MSRTKGSRNRQSLSLSKTKSKRGLASADEATRKRVASMGGLSHDESFFSEIGRKGGSK
jgi:general stress protein YciG